MITHINFAKGFRGGERQTQLLIEELSLLGHKQKLLVRKNSELTKRCQAIQNLEIVEISKPYILHCNKIKGSSILHAHETKALQFAYFCNQIFHIPYIVTRRVDNPLKTNFLNTLMYSNAKNSVALSKVIEAEILRVAPSAHTKIIPSAYSGLTLDQERIKEIKKRFEGKFLVGNIGELDNTHKGQYYLIEAAKLIHKEYPDIHFIFLGRGKDEKNYKEQSLGYSNTTFEGFVDNVGDYTACFDLFVFPSLNEGLGSILLDVMQAKVPIIATNVGGIPDIVEDKKTGLLIPPKESSAIYEAIKKLYGDRELRENLSSEALSRVHAFCKEEMAKKYEKIYKEAV